MTPAWTEQFLTCRYSRHGFTLPNLHCVGLFLAIVRDRKGIDIPYEDVGAESLIPWARQFDRAQASPDWLEVGTLIDGHLTFRPGVEDRELDLVLMRDIVGSGYHAKMLALHCGTVVSPGLLIDIAEGQGVKLKYYYDRPHHVAHGETRRAVISVLRHRLLA